MRVYKILLKDAIVLLMEIESGFSTVSQNVGHFASVVYT